ncbi:MAG: hypothetical protein A2Y17_10635 [Clostridiales bacterium GWF2_38_85]|nr:MAG: hypothetical protein A2Y17_10635 [Clostridiales bacterium GWF2_38_85]
MKKTAVIKKGEQNIIEVFLADNFFSRLFGLLPTKQLDYDSGLLIVPCRQVHTFNMKYPIDVVFLSEINVIVHIEENMNPNKMTKYYREAKSVLEIAAGTAKRKGLNSGTALTIEREKERV